MQFTIVPDKEMYLFCLCEACNVQFLLTKCPDVLVTSICQSCSCGVVVLGRRSNSLPPSHTNREGVHQKGRLSAVLSRAVVTSVHL